MTQPFHHFVPKVILRNFTDGASNSLWFYKEGRPNPHPMRQGIQPMPVQRNIDTIFGARGLNTYRTFDGTNSTDVETFLANNIESKWKDVLNELISCRTSAQLKEIDNNHGTVIRQMFVTMLRRSPEAMGRSVSTDRQQTADHMREAVEQLISEYPVSPDDIAELIEPNNMDRMGREVEVTHITNAPNPELWNHLRLCGLALARVKHRQEQLLISSNPVVFYNSADGLFRGRSVMMAISNKVLLSLDMTSQHYPVDLIKAKWSAKINHFSARQSTAIASSKKRVVLNHMNSIRGWNPDLKW